MSAPLLWIGLPILVAAFLPLFKSPRLISRIGGLTALVLAGLAWLIPIDDVLTIGPISLKVVSVFQFFGRQLILNAASKSALVIFYGLTGIWLSGANAAGVARRLVPVGMVITALLIGALAVKPFLYAALFIQTAILLATPILIPPRQTPGRGLIRFVTYQTLAMPFILFSGWLLAGVESSPSDLALAKQSAALLGLGFAFLLAIFPFSTWIPMLSEQAPPYTFGFLQWVLPITSLLFALGFIDRYAWLRQAGQLPQVLRLAGFLMLVTGGVWAAFEKRLERILAYSVITETGCALLALSLGVEKTQIVFSLFIPRAFGLALWTLGLSILKNQKASLDFAAVKGLVRRYPLAVSAIMAAHFSSSGIPLLAGFPPRVAIWETLSETSLLAAFWFGIGLLGLFLSAVRSLAALVSAADFPYWQSQENWPQRILLGAGIVVLFLLGLFPQIVQPLLSTFASMFEHLGS